MEPYEIHVAFEADEEGVVAYCDELNAVASGYTKEEAQQNLLLAIHNLLEDYSDAVKRRLRGRELTVLEAA